MEAEAAVYRVAPEIGHIDGPTGSVDGDVCYVAVLPDGPPLVLQDSAAVIWRAAREGGSLEAIVDRVSQEVGIEAAEIAGDVAAFVADLAERGVLHANPPEPDGGPGRG